MSDEQPDLAEAIAILWSNFLDTEVVSQQTLDDRPPPGVWIAQWQKRRCAQAYNLYRQKCDHTECARYRDR